MDEQSKEVLKGLAEVAWADGKVTAQERALLFHVCLQMGASAQELQEMEDIFGKQAVSAELQSVLPDKATRLNVMRALLTMSFVDGALGFAEFELLTQKSEELEITAQEMETLREQASRAAEGLKKV